MSAGSRMRSLSLLVVVAFCGACAKSAATDAGASDAATPDSGVDAGPSDLPQRDDVDGLMLAVIQQGYIHGLVVGFVDPTGSVVYGYGTVGDSGVAPTDTTLFQIASVTKTFTGLWLATQVLDGGVALADPVQKYLPNSVAVPTYDGGAITLQTLTTHTSGLPDAPTNLNPPDPQNPWATYSVADLYAFLNGYALTYAPGTQFAYSNVGEGLLGLALTLRAGGTYSDGIGAVITGPLGMVDTQYPLTAAQQPRLAPPHDGDLNPVEPWSWTDATGGAGELQSTARDLLAYAAAQAGVTTGPLSAAMTLSHQVLSDQGPDGQDQLAFNWIVEHDNLYWHNGGTYGMSSFVGFDPVGHSAVVLLADTSTQGTPTPVWSDLTTSLGFVLARWLQGVPPPQVASLLPAYTTLTPAQLQPFAGTYAFNGLTGAMTVTLGPQGLSAEAPWLWAYPIRLYPQTPTQFGFRVVDATLAFAVDGGTPDGGPQVVGATLTAPGQSYSGTKQ